MRKKSSHYLNPSARIPVFDLFLEKKAQNTETSGHLRHWVIFASPHRTSLAF